MEKLIELLNEYEWNKLYFYDDWIYCDKYDMYEVWDSLIELEIISKRYWFIKWLVENDKIDFDKVMKLWIPCFVRYDKWEIISVHDVDFYKQLIMLLSIQDNPIEFLISILK